MAKIVIKLPGVGGGTKDHNKLNNLQGGKNTLPKEMYHLTELQHSRLTEMVYENNVVTIEAVPPTGEKGVLTPIIVKYNLKSNDDELISASINNGIGDISADIDLGTKTVSGGSSVDSKDFIVQYLFDRQGTVSGFTKTGKYIAYTPQFAGVSNMTDFTTYALISSELSKFIQPTANIDKQSSPIEQYIWFISNKSTAKVYDQNDFEQTLGAWENGTTEFYTKSLVLTLADGITTSTVYLYRSRNVKNLTNFIYKIK